MRMQTVKTNITTLQELFEAFDEAGVKLQGDSHAELTQLYGRELSTMFGYAQQAIKPSMFLGLPTIMHKQCIIDFSVSDSDRPVEDKYNWHLQNTSQWLYAGAIMYDKEDKSFSAHH